jgi:hypothetical protein
MRQLQRIQQGLDKLQFGLICSSISNGKHFKQKLAVMTKVSPASDSEKYARVFFLPFSIRRAGEFSSLLSGLPLYRGPAIDSRGTHIRPRKPMK